MRLLKRLFRIFLVVTVVLVIGLAVAVNFFADPLGRRLINTINKQLTSELYVEDFDLTVFRSFPAAAINLRGVRLADTRQKTLLDAQELSFRFGLFSLLSRSIKVHTLVVSDGNLYVHYDQRGRANYDIFRSDDATDLPDAGDPDDDSSAAIDLQQATLQRLHLVYQDEQTDQSWYAFVWNAGFSGQFSAQQYVLNSEAELVSDSLLLSGQQYLTAIPIEYRADLRIDNTNSLYELQDVALTLGELPLQTQGRVRSVEDALELDLSFRSEQGTLGALFSLLPGRYRERLGEINSRGDFALTGTIDGTYSAQQSPAINSRVVVSNGQISREEMEGSVRSINFEANFTNGAQRNQRSSQLTVKPLSGQFGREPFSGHLAVSDFTDPVVDFGLDGAVPLGLLTPFVPVERSLKGQGEVVLDKLLLQGRYSDWQASPASQRVTATGAIFLRDALLRIDEQDLAIPHGNLSWQGTDLVLDSLHLRGLESDLVLDGRAGGVIPYLLADSLATEHPVLTFETTLRASQLDLDAILSLLQPTAAETAAATVDNQLDSLATVSIQERTDLTEHLDGNFRAEVASFNYGAINGTDFRGEIGIKDRTVALRGAAQAMGGAFSMDGTLAYGITPKLTARVSGERVNAKTFFEQGENFGQEVLRAEHVSGRLDTRLFVEANFDSLGNLQYDQLVVLAAVAIQDGELTNFDMLESFATYVKMKELRQIRFTNLENFIEVRNSRVYIPVMFVQSNALNLTISGEHSFDQDIAYYIKVNAGQVLTNRFKRYDPTLAPRPARRNGFFNLYYTILGNIDTYQVKAAKRRVKQEFELSELRRRRVQEQLEQAFATRIDLIREPLDWRDIPEYQGDPESGESEFLDWEIIGGGNNGPR